LWKGCNKGAICLGRRVSERST